MPKSKIKKILRDEYPIYCRDDKSNAEHSIILIGFPIRTSFTSTIHKLQGQTVNRMGLDCSELFSSGMLYTGLSRIKEYENDTLYRNP